MKRRNFVRSLLVAPAGSAALVAAEDSQHPNTQAHDTGKPSPKPNLPTRERAFRAENVPKLQTVQSDLTSNGYQHFFTITQFATLSKLGAVLMPPMKDKPGALDAKAPEFLDFLISVSPLDRQEVYGVGLDKLNAQATDRFHKPFAELNATQVDAILRPLLVARPWSEDFPDDPLKNFVARVHEDLRKATVNSREWADSSKGHPFARGFGRASGFYWRPIDPVTES
ncbi:MAG TPA: gluconate 2-dehydrogenase subunit 3 family protein [Bryobacteraceae bacterium]|nr:gluconate 2-dehydrogenase subunit 3 family protein [Bryobacteraceae bacterium]